MYHNKNINSPYYLSDEDFEPGFIPDSEDECQDKETNSNKKRQNGHMIVFTDDKPHKCNSCDYSCNNKSNLNRHVRLMHKTSGDDSRLDKRHAKSYKEDSDKRHIKSYKDDSDFDEEMEKKMKYYSCDICEKSFNRPSKLKEHVRMVHELTKEEREKEKKFSCDICGHNFNRLDRLKTHQRVHSVDATFVCDVCNAPFNALYLLHNHQEHKHPEDYKKKLTCKTCNQTFRTPTDLKKHETTHTGIKPFACDQCDASFFNKGGLNYHLQNMHLKVPKKPVYCNFCEKKGYWDGWLIRHKKKCKGPQHKCETCGKLFKSENALAKHSIEHTKIREKKSKIEKSTHYCKNCSTQFKSDYSYATHLKVCVTTFPCTICSIEFSSKEDLRNHKLEYPNSDCLCICEKCLAVFYSKEELQAHVAKKHNTNCYVCNKKFLSLGPMKNHIKLLHPDHYLADETDVKEEPDSDLAVEQDTANPSSGPIFTDYQLSLLQDVQDDMTTEQDTTDPLGENTFGLITCDICEKHFTDVDEFNTHKAGHIENSAMNIKEEIHEDENIAISDVASIDVKKEYIEETDFIQSIEIKEEMMEV